MIFAQSVQMEEIFYVVIIAQELFTQDRFDLIADSNTIRNDLIPHMVYGRNVRDQEFACHNYFSTALFWNLYSSGERVNLCFKTILIAFYIRLLLNDVKLCMRWLLGLLGLNLLDFFS